MMAMSTIPTFACYTSDDCNPERRSYPNDCRENARCDPSIQGSSEGAESAPQQLERVVIVGRLAKGESSPSSCTVCDYDEWVRSGWRASVGTFLGEQSGVFELRMRWDEGQYLWGTGVFLWERLDTRGAGKVGTSAVVSSAAKSQYRGGRHGDMVKPRGDGKDSHHAPANGTIPGVSRNDAPAIQMDRRDHQRTSSNPAKEGRPAADAYRNEAAERWKENPRDAMAREIKDIRNAAKEGSGDRTKYNFAVREMLQYIRSMNWLRRE
jgi:hypothetical protein